MIIIDVDGKEVALDEEEVIGKAGQEWAQGCPKCKFGVVASAPLTRACEIYMERLVHHVDGEIVYCDCRAGQAASKRSQEMWAFLLIDARTDTGMSDSAAKDTHPQIEIARAAIHKSRAMAKEVPPLFDEDDEFPAPPPMRFEKSYIVLDDEDEEFPEPSPMREAAAV